jgi:hypothetical protein
MYDSHVARPVTHPVLTAGLRGYGGAAFSQRFETARSRKTRPPYTELEIEFVKAACHAGRGVFLGSLSLGPDAQSTTPLLTASAGRATFVSQGDSRAGS